MTCSFFREDKQELFRTKVNKWKNVWANSRVVSFNSFVREENQRIIYMLEAYTGMCSSFFIPHTREGAWLGRVLSGHWNRHHFKEVNQLLKRLNTTEPVDSKNIIGQLESCLLNKINRTGDMAALLKVLKEVTKYSEENSLVL